MTQDLFGVRPASTEDNALKFLKRFARRMRGKAFSPETVVLKAMDNGIAFGDQRKWGDIFKQAATDGVIRQSQELFARSTSNGSRRPGWIGI
jgi:hypothetical protein